MKKQEKERLHEDDRFIKFVSAGWDRVVAQRRKSLLAVLVVVVSLGTWAVVSGTRQHLADKERSAVETAETIEQMEQVAEKYPNAPDLLLNLGRAYARRGDKGDLQRAGAALERALASSTVPLQRGMISLDLGIVKTNQGNLEGALEHLDEAARIAEGRPVIASQANWHAGRCFELLGQPEKALERYSRIKQEGGDSLWFKLAQYRQIKLRQKELD